MRRAVEGLSRAVVSAMSVVDFEEVVIDGLLRPDWRRRVVDGVTSAYGRFDCTGLSPIEIAAGSIGPQARVLGAALLPLIGRFSPDTDLLVKTAKISASVDRKPAIDPGSSETLTEPELAENFTDSRSEGRDGRGIRFGSKRDVFARRTRVRARRRTCQYVESARQAALESTLASGRPETRDRRPGSSETSTEPG